MDAENKKARRKAAEARELQKIEKENLKSTGKYYLFMLMVVLTFIYIVDEIASNMNTTMQPSVIVDFYKLTGIEDQRYGGILAALSGLIMGPTMLLMLIGPFYKSLADKFGRKPFLIINTIVMSVGLLICVIAPNITIYIAGILLVVFVQSNDMQVMYIMETAPAEHRAKLCSVTKAIALVGVSLIGVSRKLFYTPEVPSSWRYVFLAPGLFGLVVALICIPFIRETPVFRKKRAEFLKLTDEEREVQRLEAEAEAKKQKAENGGVINALKFIFKTPQLRYSAIAGFLFCLATGVTSYYSTILEASSSAGKITDAQISSIIIIFPFVNGAVTFVCGFISDALGRKKSSLTITTIAVVGLVGFVLGCSLGWHVAAIAGFYGLFIGCLWSVSDTIALVIPSESTPTELRASVIGTISLFVNIAMFLGIILIIGVLNLVPRDKFGLACLCASAPFLLVSILLLLTKVKETAGSDLGQV